MPNVTGSVQSQEIQNNIGSLLNNPNNVYNKTLGGLPNNTNEDTTDVETIDLTDLVIGTDIVTSSTDLTNTALDYEVWAASWSGVDGEATSVVPIVWVNDMSGYVGPVTGSTSDDYVTSGNFADFKTKLTAIPLGRRVIQPTFWAADCPPDIRWDSQAKNNYYANSSRDGAQYSVIDYSGEEPVVMLYDILTPFSDVNLTNIKTSFSEFLDRCNTNNLKFDYISDDSETYGRFHIWSTAFPPVNPTTTEDLQVANINNQYILPAIITDSSLDFTKKKNLLNNKAFSTDFYDRYTQLIAQTNGTDRSVLNHDPSWFVAPKASAVAALTPLYGFNTSTTAIPWKDSSNNAATRAWGGTLKNWSLSHYRSLFFNDLLSTKGFGNVKVSEYDLYPLTVEEAKYVEDMNGGNWSEPVIDTPNFYVSPYFYGLVGQLKSTAAYKINPQNDDQKYIYTKVNPTDALPEGVLRYDPVWLAFMNDMKLLRGVIRSSNDAWDRLTPWVADWQFTDGSGNYQYVNDKRYWKELLFHLCLHGTRHFQFFTNTTTSSVDLHEVLDEWYTISNNSRARPVLISRIPVNSKVIISGGLVLKTGKYLWRITAAPSVSNTLRAYGSSVGRTDIPQSITLDANTRGVWLETTSNVAPVYALDESAQNFDPIYITELDYSLRDTNSFRMKAFYGGSSDHDYGSGMGVSEDGKIVGGFNYLKTSNVKCEFRRYENDDSWMYEHLHDIQPNGQPVEYQIQRNLPPAPKTPLTSSLNYLGVPVYNSEPLTVKWFKQEMSTSGEWGPALRPSRPFPNDDIYGYATYPCILDVPQEDGSTKSFTQPQYDPNLPIDKKYFHISNWYSNSNNSFWVKSIENGGRPDLAYNYDGNGTITLKTNFEYPVKTSNITQEIISSANGDPVKREPGSSYKYIGDCFAPILEEDGTCDYMFFDRFVEGLEKTKEYEELKYKLDHLTNPPPSLIQNKSGSTDEHFENGVFRPKTFHIDIEAGLTNMISVDPTYRAGINQYGSHSNDGSHTLDAATFQRVIASIKTLRKIVYYTRQIIGNQANILFYDPIGLPIWSRWAGWAGNIWEDMNQNVSPSRYATCPYCNELLTAEEFPYTPEQFINLSDNLRFEYATKALEKIRDRAIDAYKAFSRVLFFKAPTGDADVLDLRAEFTRLFPQIDSSNFIITGLNHYPNSAPDFINHNTYVYYSLVSNGFQDYSDTDILTDYRNETIANYNRYYIRAAKEVATVNNVRSGQMYSQVVQGVCGSDFAPNYYEYYNSNFKNDAGYMKAWGTETGGYTTAFDAVELNQFPETPSTSHPAGERKISTGRSHRNNYNRRSLLRHCPRINITNAELYKMNIATSIQNQSEVIFSWNPAFSAIMGNLGSRLLTAKEDYINQYRPCAQGETPTTDANGIPTCRDITTKPYSTPHAITDNFKLRRNDYKTFLCDPSTEPATCVNYCYGVIEPGMGDTAFYSMTQLLMTRKWAYELAIEYASYDDSVAIPYADFTNENYWFGYYGRNAKFDPYVTTPPASVSQALAMDDTIWPYYQRSETGKRMDALAMILASRKEATMFKFYKNPPVVHKKDWPQQPAKFTVNRKPGTAITIPIAGGYTTKQYLGWVGDNTNYNVYWKKDTGIPLLIENYLTWNYNRGMRRFLIWTPCGVLLTPDGTGWGYTSAITSAMKQRVYDILDKNGEPTGEQIINPSEACWDGNNFDPDPVTGLRIPQTIEEALSTETIFDEDGRLNEWMTHLGQWISNHPEADVGLYVGYTIPTEDGVPSGDITIYGDVGTGSRLENTTTGKGWQVPNPANNSSHRTFLETELGPWMNIGISFLGFDVGQGMFNYENGGTTSYGDNAASKDPVGDYKSWLQTKWPQLDTVIAEALPIDMRAPIVNEFNQVVNTTYPRKTIYTKDPTKEVCKGNLVQDKPGDTFNRTYSPDNCWKNEGRERFRKLDIDGKNYTTATSPNDFVYVANAYQYCPYLIAVNGWLDSGEWNVTEDNFDSFAGLDPNKMLCWNRENTEINAFFEEFAKLSTNMMEKYRTLKANGTSVDLWQLTPAWDDEGLAEPTTSLVALSEWDGRNHQRDTDYYNAVRNEVFVKIKNYIDRGYVFWSSIGKGDFQIWKDVHADTILYVKGFELDTTPYAEDLTSSYLTTNRRLLNSPNKTALDNLLGTNG